ncbi:hypothetical protein MKX01_014718, partial [Papaver californicum]
MSSANRESGDDRNRQSHEEIIDIKLLLKVLVDSHNKQVESLVKLADKQANTQQQIIDSLKSSCADSNIHKPQ